ncbi:hypothetical protein BCh11DRAFT_01988 [Burkholderia sp. Ch1-1]|nr:hypothetical protein BCh11DRAFT_01988 [Burkholderia sp. Ch1-1]
MFNDPDLRNSLAAGSDARARMDGLSLSAAAPPRFGRLAMCVAVASALAIGVLGTVAYGVWFNQDQQVYAEAMAGARKALGNGAPVNAALIAKPAGVTSSTSSTSVATTGSTVTASPTGTDPEAGGQWASWSGEVARHSGSRLPAAFVAEAAPAAASAPSATSSARRSAGLGNPPAQQPVSTRPAKDSRATPQERRATPNNARHKDNPFTRLGLFFRRVNYRQHGNANRQDIYSHP